MGLFSTLSGGILDFELFGEVSDLLVAVFIEESFLLDFIQKYNINMHEISISTSKKRSNIQLVSHDKILRVHDVVNYQIDSELTFSIWIVWIASSFRTIDLDVCRRGKP